MSWATERPAPSEYESFYQGYIDRVPPGDVRDLLRAQQETFRRLPELVPADREEHRYAPGKWSVRQVIGHLGDAERAFGFRAFCFSRGEQAALPGFDENHYVATAGSDRRSLADLADELTLLRGANVRLFAALGEEGWAGAGTANGKQVTVRALAYILVGHAAHHFAVLRERYGLAAL